MLFKHAPKNAPGNESLNNSTAVLLIDMQEDFLGNVSQKNKDRIITNQITIIRHCAEHNIPLVVLEFCGHGSTIGILKSETKKVPRLTTITKFYDSGFYNTTLETHLNTLGVRNLILMGLCAGFCVLSTAEDALELNFSVETSNQVIAGMHHHEKDNYIHWYKDNGARVTPNLVETFCL